MKFKIFFALLLPLLLNASIWDLFSSNPQQEKINLQIQNTYNDLVYYSQQSERYSGCYKEALSKLHHGCKGLKDNDNERSKIAVHFTNCHLMKSGLAPYTCTDYMNIQECTQNMLTSPIAFNAYTQFSSHVENLCFYIQSEEFNTQIENNIKELIHQTSKSSQELVNIRKQSSEIEQSVSNSIQNQEKLLEEQDTLKNKLVVMQNEEDKHFNKLGSTFNQIHSLSNMLQSQISKLNEEQKQILEEQLNLKIMSEKHINEFDKINKIILNMNEYTKLISTNQIDIKDGMISIKDSQQNMASLVKDSIDNQNQLVKGQEHLLEEQVKLNQITKNSMKDFNDLSKSAVENVKDSIENQKKLIEIQKESDLKFQKLQQQQEESFAKAKKDLDDLLMYSNEQTKRIKDHHNQFSKSSKRLFETVNHILNLHNSLIGEFMNIENIFYYVSCVILSYILTTTSFTYNARIYLFLELTLNFFVEKMIIQYSIGKVITEIIHDRISLCRRIFVLIYLFTLLISIFLYKNYEKMNYNLLLNLMKKSDDIQNEIQNIQQENEIQQLFKKKREKIQIRYIE